MHGASQASDCPCGCRTAGFSEQLIKQRGIYAQLIQVAQSDGQVFFRHLHPCELALLNGMPPPMEWLNQNRPPLKLGLCAIGQLASPLQSVWIGSCLMKHLHHLWDLPDIYPSEVLQGFRSRLFQIAKEMFPNVQAALATPAWTCLKYADGTQVHVQVLPNTTLVELFQAELALTPDAEGCEWIDDATGQPLEYHAPVGGRCIRVASTHANNTSTVVGTLAPEMLAQIPLDFEADAPIDDDFPSTMPESVACPATTGLPMPSVMPDVPGSRSSRSHVEVPSAAVPGHVMDTLSNVKRLHETQLVNMLPPLATSIASCANFRQVTVHGPSRLEVLAKEGSAMADDELSLHLRACVMMSGRTDVQFLDPLLATGWLQGGHVAIVKEWLDQFPDLKSIVTAVHVMQHWMPVVWTFGVSEVQVSMWEHTDSEVECLSPLHGLISQAANRPMFSLACTRRSFARGYCGAAAVAFMSHKLLGHDLPKNEAALVTFHQDLKASFAAACQTKPSLPKPWFWGLGIVDVFGLTSELLKAHGVPVAQVQMRTKLVIQALGKTEVLSAVSGGAPWKTLKALANQQSPPLQLVLPDELTQHNAAKLSTKTKKPKATRALPQRPAELDPAKLVLERGAFCVGQDEPLDQISFATVGPLARGVVVTTYAEALPFLQAGKLLTNHGLAMLVLHPPAEVSTSLVWSSIRFAARCTVNQEPMLVTGILVQLGQSTVYQYKAKNIPAIQAVEVACARIAVYKDMWEGSWEDFSNRPVKHVLSVLPCLNTCRSQSDCQCTGWHPTSEQPHDALLDVFRRQYFTDAGRPVKWDQASHFSVMIRYAKSLETQVLCASGTHGVFIEPKTEDALKPHSDYQVVWLPQMDFQSVAHRAKCEVECLGVARSGKRFGLRTHVNHFQRLFTSTKPDAVYLAPGERLTFHSGPWPFGSDRKSIARALKASGWDCRPLQPLHHVPGGLMWALQAVTEPPVNVLPMQHGQVVITCQDDKGTSNDQETQVVGHVKTVELCRPGDATMPDPWLANDPWSKAVQQVPALPAQAPAPHVLQEIEQRLEKTLLEKLPTVDKMEVDDQDLRLQTLEQQVQQLASRQTVLEHTVQDNHQQQTAQVQTLQQQMKVQLDMQSQQMQTMLTDQMTRLEAILAKKPRTE